MLDQALDKIDPVIANALFTLIMGSLGSLGWVGITIRKLLMTKAAQDNLHRALDTSVDYVTDQIAALIADGFMRQKDLDGITDKMVDYVQGSVPGSLKKLKASPAQLKRMVQARLNVRIDQMAPFDPVAHDLH
jgi:hypothetical protein